MEGGIRDRWDGRGQEYKSATKVREVECERAVR